MAAHKPKQSSAAEEGSAQGQDTYKVFAVSDLHINRIYHTRKSNGHYTHFGNRTADGFFKALGKVDELVIVGDAFNIADKSNVQKLLELENKEKKEYRVRHRHKPKKLLEQLLEDNPHLKVTYLIGNHEAESASANSKFLRALERMRHEYPNFSYADNYAHGNLFLFHGHTHVQFVEGMGKKFPPYFRLYPARDTRSEEERSGEEYRERPYLSVDTRANQRFMEQLCQTDIVRDFVESQVVWDEQKHYEHDGKKYLIPKGKKNIYIGIGHRHQPFDAKPIELPEYPGVTLHLTDLGCTLPGRRSNFKIYHFAADGVAKVETVDLKEISRASESQAGRG